MRIDEGVRAVGTCVVAVSLVWGLVGCGLTERPEGERPPAQHTPVPQSGSDVVPEPPELPQSGA